MDQNTRSIHPHTYNPEYYQKYFHNYRPNLDIGAAYGA